MIPSLDMVRGSLQVLTLQHGEGLQIQHLFGVFPNTPHTTLRAQVNILARKGEVEKVGTKGLRYTGKPTLSSQAPAREKAWRLIRIQRPGWTVADIACVTHGSANNIARFVEFLLREGYVVQVGRKGTAPCYRTTAKGVQERFAPQPVEQIYDEFLTEKKAAAKLVLHMLTRDLDNEVNRGLVANQLSVLNARFCTQDENTTTQTMEETDGEN